MTRNLQELTPSNKNRRGRVAGRAAVAMLAFIPAGAFDAAAHAELVAKRDPILTRTDTRLNRLAAEMEGLVHKKDPGAYREVVMKDGKQTERLVLSHPATDLKTGRKFFEQVIVYRRIGHELPLSAAVIVGTKSRKFSVGEDFDSMTAVLINEDKPDDYLVTDIFKQNNGWENNFYEKDGLSNTLQTNADPAATISHKQMAEVFDSVTGMLLKLGGVGNKPSGLIT